MPFIEGKIAEANQRTGRIGTPEISTGKELGNYKVKVYLNSITAENLPERRIYFNGGYILIGKK